MRWLRRILAVGVVLLVGLLLLHRPLLRGAASLLCVQDSLETSSLIFVLNGDLQTRPFGAARLYHAGLAPLIVVPTPPPSPAERIGVLPNEGELVAEVLEKEGVPDSAISRLPAVASSTWEEGAALAGYLREHGLADAIVVTSGLHTRRARWTMAKQLDGSGARVSVAEASGSCYGSRDWWLSEEGLLGVTNEYLKTAYYFLRY